MNIIVFGELPIATKVVEFLSEFDNVSIPCVVCENYDANNFDPWLDKPMLFQYAKANRIPIIKLNYLVDFCKDIEVEIGITARFSKILKSEHIKLFKKGVINLHGGLLPEFGGLYSVNHMILSGIHSGGGSIHWIDQGIDTGDLIRRCVCNIDENDTALTLHYKVQEALFKGICEVIESGIKYGFSNIDLEKLPVDVESNYYNSKSIAGLKEIKAEELFTDKSLRVIRAFDFPGYEPAYTFINDSKIELRYSKPEFNY